MALNPPYPPEAHRQALLQELSQRLEGVAELTRELLDQGIEEEVQRNRLTQLENLTREVRKSLPLPPIIKTKPRRDKMKQ